MTDLVSSSGGDLDHIVYDPFGNVVTQTNASNGDRFMFAGMQYDSTTGLYYDHARYYDSVTGRFMSQDPTGFKAGDTNLYRYVDNAPTVGTDPSGEQKTLGEILDSLFQDQNPYMPPYFNPIFMPPSPIRGYFNPPTNSSPPVQGTTPSIQPVPGPPGIFGGGGGSRPITIPKFWPTWPLGNKGGEIWIKGGVGVRKPFPYLNFNDWNAEIGGSY